MLYKDIIFNNQAIKEVRCADEVIWKKKISQLLQLMDVTGKSETRVNEVCVRGKNIYAYCQREYKDRFIVKAVNENGNLRVVNTVDLLSTSEVFVCDPKLDDIVYVVGKINSSSYNDELLCIDMGTSQKKVAYSYNLGSINAYGYNNYGIAIWDGAYIHFFEHNNDRTGFSTITIKEYKYEKPVDMPSPSVFSKEYSDKEVWYLSEPYNGSPDKVQIVFMLMYGYVTAIDTSSGPAYIMGIRPTPYFDVPYSLSSSSYDSVSNLFLYEENDVDMIYAFVSKDGKLFVFDDVTKKSLEDQNKTLKQRQDCFKIKLDVGKFRVKKCKYDRDSNILFMSTEIPAYENGKRIGFKAFKIDTKNNTAKLLASYELDRYTNYFGFDVDGTDVYVGSNENINGKTFASILYEQLSVPTPPVATENNSTIKPKYQWNIKDTTTYVKKVTDADGVYFYQIKDNLIDKTKDSVFVFVVDYTQEHNIEFAFYDTSRNSFVIHSGELNSIFVKNKRVTFMVSAVDVFGVFENFGAYKSKSEAVGKMYYFELDYRLEVEDEDTLAKFKNEIKAWAETL